VTPAAEQTLSQEDRHWWFASRTRVLMGLVGGALLHSGSNTETLRVLDVGCGAGNMTHHLQRYGKVTGIDSFVKPLAVAAERGFQVRLAWAEAMPFAAACFSLVAALDVVEHCDDDAQVIRECARVLRPGGLLAVTVPAFPWLWSDNDTINRHRRRYTPVQLSQLLRSAGLSVRRLTCNNFLVLPIAVALILLRRFRGQPLALAAPATDDDAYQVEMLPVHPYANAVLSFVGATEAALLQRVSLPIGTGLIAVAEKPR